MSLQGSMHSLTQEIIGSFEARAAGIAALRSQAFAQREAARAQLDDLRKAHQAMAEQLRADMAKGRADLARSEGRRKTEVATWIKGTATARAGAQREWQELAATMQARRAPPCGAAPPREAPAPTTAASRKAPKAFPLRDRVFQFLAGHPDGTSLTGLEQEFSASRFQTTQALRKLTEQGKVEKRGSRHFAT